MPTGGHGRPPRTITKKPVTLISTTPTTADELVITGPTTKRTIPIKPTAAARSAAATEAA